SLITAVTALQAIRRKLKDPLKNLSSWKKSDPCTANWTGVICIFEPTDAYLHVTELRLLNKNLSGTLAPELGQLSYMQILDFMWNNITGSIPKEIGKITALQLLLLSGNQISGPLPDELGFLPNLTKFQLDLNYISGPIPKSFVNLPKVKHFHMNNNSISGQIPPELSALPLLQHILLDNNMLSGYLPPELSKMPSLKILQLDNNDFNGSTIPGTYSNMSKLLKLDLSNNNLTGSIPSNRLSDNITTIDLASNMLNGSIPSNFSGLPHLQKLSLGKNRLSGSVPSTIWKNITFTPDAKLLLLEGNPVCTIPNQQNIVRFCGPEDGDNYPPGSANNSGSGNNSDVSCLPQSCPTSHHFEYVLDSPGRCFCAAPFGVGLRLRSPSISDFPPYTDQFKVFITRNLGLDLYQLLIQSIEWQRGPRLKMYLKFFPQYSNHSMTFNISEVQRIANMIATFAIPGSDIFGPYDLLYFTLEGPYSNGTSLEQSHYIQLAKILQAYLSPYFLVSSLGGGLPCSEGVFIRPTKTGISKGTLIGIVLGSISCGIGVLLVIIFVFLRRHPRCQQEALKHQSCESVYDYCHDYSSSSTTFTQNGPEGTKPKYPGCVKESNVEIPRYYNNCLSFAAPKAALKIEGVKEFSFKELEMKTSSFCTTAQVGEGGYGKVYKGILDDGTAVAIKRAQQGSLQGEKEFYTEIELLSRLHHRNLVSLVGYCDEQSEQMLVYEFMPNGSLHDHLSGRHRGSLSFATRVHIALGAAKGILYLHSDVEPPIIHRDIKANNILLDSNFTAKVSDFGISRLAPVADAKGVAAAHISTNVKGTPGYLDPEYFLTHKLTEKSDIYSLGIVFLELLTGMKPISHGRNIVREVNAACQSGLMFSIIDGTMGMYPSECIKKFMELALRCSQEKTELRPKMLEVVRELENISSMLPKTERVQMETDTSTSETSVSALLAVRRNLVDRMKHLKKWNRGDPCTSNWTGVLCFGTIGADGYLHVQELQLLNMNLSGSLAPELGQLSHLQILDFMWNQLSGSIPKEIGNIASLKLLLLNGNKLSGSLPDELGYLSNLKRLQVDQNQISGPIPQSFSNLKSVKHLHLNNNSISGQIPSDLSNISSLLHLLLDNNNLSGYLPPVLSTLPVFRILQLDNNNFNGAEIPTSYANLTSLVKLSLRNCSLQGAVPDLSRIPNLSYLDLSWNQLTGTIPLNKLSETITTIDLSNNLLNGSIPTSFSNLPSLQTLSLTNNLLSGSVPADIWKNKSFSATARLRIDLRNNSFSRISGDLNPPANITLRLEENPICSNTNLQNIDQFCGPEAGGDDTPDNSINSTSVCPIPACPVGNYFEYVPTSPVPCFCASPLRIGYRLKSPSFSYFPPYIYQFEMYLTSSLYLELYQLYIDSYVWEKGPRLRMDLKLFPKAGVDHSNTFNASEVLRMRGIFTSWEFAANDLFGPYELLNFTLLGPYSYASKLSIKIDGVKSFNFEEMALATDGFNSSALVGEGGYGKVYKGILSDNTSVAIKRAKERSLQGEKEFFTEILMLSRLHHRNLVSLVGYCDEEDEQMLVYEFMPYGTLQDWLSGRKIVVCHYEFLFGLAYCSLGSKPRGTLNFITRLRIALGSAMGILYLHTEAQPPIFHRDIKASNILLDSNLSAKVADFGLSRLAPVMDDEGAVPNHVSTIVKGTPGYLDPEYFLTHKLTDKSDVYSLGVVYLEILTGMKPISHGKNIVREVNLAHQSGTMFSIIDSRMGSYPSDCVEKFIALALRCCLDKPEERPTMLDVVRELENIIKMVPDTGADLPGSRSRFFGESSSSASLVYTSRDPYTSSNGLCIDLTSGSITAISPR
ncbi:hypothetical protein RJ640_010380, partial [Escallonia rubra]